MSELYIVATPIGNLNDISKRALDTLNDVDLILAEDTRHTLKLLNYFNIKTRMEAYHKFNEKQKTSEILDVMIEKNMKVAVVTDAGTPCISDPGYEIVKCAHEKGITVYGVPGASAVILALSVAGFNTDRFSFFGFIPRENKETKLFYEDILASNVKSVVVYESPKRIVKSLGIMRENLGDVNIAVLSDMTKFHERIYRGKINDVIERLENNENAEKGEYAIVIEIPEREHDENTDNDFSIEAKLIDIIVKQNLTMKDAIKILSKDSNVSKSIVYDASIKLKELFER